MMKRLLGLGFVGFMIALAVVIGYRMSTDAMAVVIGVIFGVAASIPTSLLIIAATRRPAAEERRTRRDEPERQTPPIIVVSPGGLGNAWSSPPTSLPPPPPAGARRFRVVGEDGSLSTWDETMSAEGDAAEWDPW